MSESIEQDWKTLPEHTYERYVAYFAQKVKIVDNTLEKDWREFPTFKHDIYKIYPDGSRTITYHGPIEGAEKYIADKLAQRNKLSDPARRRADFLEVVKGYVIKDRANTHGDAEDNFEDISQMLNIVLQKHLKEPLHSHDVARIMMCVKLARTVSSPAALDHWHDIAGYAACGGGILMAHNERVNVEPNTNTDAK